MSSNDADYKAELRQYLSGFALALTLTLLPFTLVAWGGLERLTTVIVIAFCALIQMVVHFRFFLHIDFSRQKREDLQLILFTTLILSIMAGGTIWIVFNLAGRM